MKNKPNILSNELDQAPKTHRAWYDKVVKSLKEEIKNAMDQVILTWDGALCDYIDNNYDKVPVRQILALEPGQSLSFEVKREKQQGKWWFIKAVWHPAFMWDFRNFTDNCYRFEKYWAIKPWQKSLVIVVEKDRDDDKLLKVHAEQLEYPWPNSFVMRWMFFHNPDVSEEEFAQILSNEDAPVEDAEKNDNKDEKTKGNTWKLKWFFDKLKK